MCSPLRSFRAQRTTQRSSPILISWAADHTFRIGDNPGVDQFSYCQEPNAHLSSSQALSSIIEGKLLEYGWT